MFALDDGGQISVADYFNNNYGIKLNRPDFVRAYTSIVAIFTPAYFLIILAPGQSIEDGALADRALFY